MLLGFRDEEVVEGEAQPPEFRPVADREVRKGRVTDCEIEFGGHSALTLEAATEWQSDQ